MPSLFLQVTSAQITEAERFGLSLDRICQHAIKWALIHASLGYSPRACEEPHIDAHGVHK